MTPISHIKPAGAALVLTLGLAAQPALADSTYRQTNLVSDLDGVAAGHGLFGGISAVPEPASGLLVLAGLVCVVLLRSRMRDTAPV